MDNTNLYPLIERIGNLLRTEIRRIGNNHGLQPVHLQALTYLARCNRYSDTSATVTEYLGATKGTVSQTLKVLEKKAYIYKVSDEDDKRVQHLKVSKSGLEILSACIPPAAFSEAASRISEAESTELVNLLTRMLRELQQSNRSKTFGVCKSCQFFNSDGTRYHCGLTREALSTADSEKICREHTPAPVGQQDVLHRTGI
ncbi:MAG: MarR family winged helix-turn-helix transcriptional regulator [Methylococcales bacterium]